MVYFAHWNNFNSSIDVYTRKKNKQTNSSIDDMRIELQIQQNDSNNVTMICRDPWTLFFFARTRAQNGEMAPYLQSSLVKMKKKKLLLVLMTPLLSRTLKMIQVSVLLPYYDEKKIPIEMRKLKGFQKSMHYMGIFACKKHVNSSP